MIIPASGTSLHPGIKNIMVAGKHKTEKIKQHLADFLQDFFRLKRRTINPPIMVPTARQMCLLETDTCYDNIPFPILQINQNLCIHVTKSSRCSSVILKKKDKFKNLTLSWSTSYFLVSDIQANRHIDKMDGWMGWDGMVGWLDGKLS